MKSLALVLSLVTLLLAGCSAETVAGPEDNGRVVVPAEGPCNPHIQPC